MLDYVSGNYGGEPVVREVETMAIIECRLKARIRTKALARDIYVFCDHLGTDDILKAIPSSDDHFRSDRAARDEQ